MASTPTTEPAPYPRHCGTIPLKAPDFCNIKNVHMVAAHVILHSNHWFLCVLGSLFKVLFRNPLYWFCSVYSTPSQVNIDTLRQCTRLSPPPFSPILRYIQIPMPTEHGTCFSVLLNAQYTDYTFIASLL
jgi:hypothetical protein